MAGWCATLNLFGVSVAERSTTYTIPMRLVRVVAALPICERKHLQRRPATSHQHRLRPSASLLNHLSRRNRRRSIILGNILPAMTRRRGNPNWGRPALPAPAVATAFEVQVQHLGLTKRMYAASAELRRWCERNRNRCYIPEWLLEEWGIEVDPNIAPAA